MLSVLMTADYWVDGRPQLLVDEWRLKHRSSDLCVRNTLPDPTFYVNMIRGSVGEASPGGTVVQPHRLRGRQ